MLDFNNCLAKLILKNTLLFYILRCTKSLMTQLKTVYDDNIYQPKLTEQKNQLKL